MTVDERKMAIAYADLINMQELVQHIMRMDADELMDNDTRFALVQLTFNLDKVASGVGKYMSKHTDFNTEEGLDGKTES